MRSGAAVAFLGNQGGRDPRDLQRGPNAPVPHGAGHWSAEAHVGANEGRGPVHLIIVLGLGQVAAQPPAQGRARRVIHVTRPWVLV